jgi:hypothetical protein
VQGYSDAWQSNSILAPCEGLKPDLIQANYANMLFTRSLEKTKSGTSKTLVVEGKAVAEQGHMV